MVQCQHWLSGSPPPTARLIRAMTVDLHASGSTPSAAEGPSSLGLKATEVVACEVDEKTEVEEELPSAGVEEHPAATRSASAQRRANRYLSDMSRPPLWFAIPMLPRLRAGSPSHWSALRVTPHPSGFPERRRGSETAPPAGLTSPQQQRAQPGDAGLRPDYLDQKVRRRCVLPRSEPVRTRSKRAEG